MLIHNLRDMGSTALHRGERVVNIGGRGERVQGTQLVPGEGLLEPFGGDSEGVLHVQVAHVGSVAVGNDEAGVAATCHGAFQFGGGAAEGQGDELIAGHHDFVDVLLGEFEGAFNHAGVIFHGAFRG